MEEKSTNKIAVFSIDVEEWYHLEYFKNSKTDRKKSVMDGLNTFIKIVDKHNIKASFFIVGELIQTLKSTIKNLDIEGHDIGLHSYFHKRPVVQNINEFIKDTKDTISEMKSILPNNSFGYRSPCFAIDRERLDEVIQAAALVLKDKSLYLLEFKKVMSFLLALINDSNPCISILFLLANLLTQPIVFTISFKGNGPLFS